MNQTLQLICICTIYFILFNTSIESPISNMWNQVACNNNRTINIQFFKKALNNSNIDIPKTTGECLQDLTCNIAISQASYFHGISKVAYKTKCKVISGKSVGSGPISSHGRWSFTEWVPWQRWKFLADGPTRCHLYWNYRPVLEDIDLMEEVVSHWDEMASQILYLVEACTIFTNICAMPSYLNFPFKEGKMHKVESHITQVW